MKKITTAVALATCLLVTGGSASTSLAQPVVLAKPVKKPTAHASSGYVHLLNCQQALLGANGDNDIQQWLNNHTPFNIHHSSWDGYTRYNNVRLVVYVAFWKADGSWWGTRAGYCMGDDSNIVDTFDRIPYGW
jgi:hypothetical protein